LGAAFFEVLAGRGAAVRGRDSGEDTLCFGIPPERCFAQGRIGLRGVNLKTKPILAVGGFLGAIWATLVSGLSGAGPSWRDHPGAIILGVAVGAAAAGVHGRRF